MTLRLVAAAAATVLLAACSPGSPPPPGALVIPAVWAGRTDSGELVGGMEPATVSIATVGEPGFSVDLADVEAQGAGPQWLAATSVAAAVGTLYSGADPRSIDIGYTITGPIDGPSAGAILTVGTIAAIQGDELRPGITMTGTIAPDGTIGVVSLVSTKIRSAAKSGYTTILIPFGTERESQGQGAEPLDLIALGKDLGIEVRVVLDLGEAYEAFTGVALGQAQVAPPLAPKVAELAARQASDLAQRVRSESTGGLVDVGEIDAALRAEKWALAYGLSVDALQVLGRAKAEEELRTTYQAKGAAAAGAELAARIEGLRGKAEANLQAGSKVEGMGLEQVISTAYALGWSVSADAELEAVQPFADSPDEAILVAVARAVSDAGLDTEVFGPDALAIVRAASSEAVGDDAAAIEFLSGYTNFLVNAGTSALAYYRAAVPNYSSGLPGDLEPVVQVLANRAGAIPAAPSSLAEEVRQLATVVSFYLGGQSLVTGASLGITGSGIGEDPISGESRDALATNAIATGAAAAFTWADRVREGGSGIDYPIWQTDWGTSLFASRDGSSREDAAAVTALDEIWSAVVNCLMSRAAQDALRASPSPAGSG